MLTSPSASSESGLPRCTDSSAQDDAFGATEVSPLVVPPDRVTAGSARVEVILRRRLSAENSWPPLDHIEIQLERALLAQDIVGHRSQACTRRLFVQDSDVL